MRSEERQSLQEQTSGQRDPAANGVPSDNDSLTSVLEGFSRDGFTASYRPAPEPVEGRAAVVCGACGRSTAAEDLHVVGERRLEGASEPDEMVLAVAATCPACGMGGVLVLGYGPEASPEDSDLVLALSRPPAATARPGPDGGAGRGSDAGDGSRSSGLGRIGD